MCQIIEIKDLSDPGLDIFARLTDTQLRNKADESLGIFIAESPKVIAIALDYGCVPVALLMEHRHICGQGKDIISRCGTVPVYTGERDILSKLTGYALTRGILCAMKRPASIEISVLCERAKRIAVLEGIVDASNIGAIFRSAAALNVDGILLSPDCCDPLCRRAIRVSMGTVFQVPWARFSGKFSDWPFCGVSILHDFGFQLAAMALTDNSVSLAAPSLHNIDKLAVFLGTEGTGLRTETISMCDHVVKIPMSHHVDSLNVAAASAVAFWELCAKM